MARDIKEIEREYLTTIVAGQLLTLTQVILSAVQKKTPTPDYEDFKAYADKIIRAVQEFKQ